MKLNLGCGLRPLSKEEGWINIDHDPTVSPDKVWDITWGLPYLDRTCDEFMLSHVMEHLTQEQIVHLMREIWRVGTPNAIVKIISPLWTHISAWDLDHKSVITNRTFAPFLWHSGVESFKRYNLDYIKFEEVEIFDDTNGNRHHEPQIYVTLKVVK